MEITCNELWRDWMVDNPSNPLVIQGKAKISSYSKDDWAIMVKEATSLVDGLVYLVNNNIEFKSDIARKSFFDLIEHLDKWFFTPTVLYLVGLKDLLEKDGKMRNYYNQFQDGLADYLSKLIYTYHKEVY